MFQSACHILRETWTNCCFRYLKEGVMSAYLSVSYRTTNNTLYSVKTWSMLVEWMSEWMIIKPWHSMYEHKSWFWRRMSEIQWTFSQTRCVTPEGRQMNAMKDKSWLAVKRSFITTRAKVWLHRGVKHGMDDRWSQRGEGMSASCGESANVTICVIPLINLWYYDNCKL